MQEPIGVCNCRGVINWLSFNLSCFRLVSWVGQFIQKEASSDQKKKIQKEASVKY